MSDVAASRERLARIVDRLSAASEKQYVNAFTCFEWPQSLDRGSWTMSPELVSLYGTPLWEGLDDARRKALSFFEIVNFFSVTLNGERFLVDGLNQDLYAANEAGRLTRYIHHVIDEENKHMQFFGKFCMKYAGKVYPDKKLAFEREYAPGEEEFLFFARVVVFEQISDAVNIRIMEDERLPDVVRRINGLHHQEETRHLAFHREITRLLWDIHAPGWTGETVAGVREYLREWAGAIWREMCNPAAYRDAGIAKGLEAREAALADPGRRALRDELNRAHEEFFIDAGIFEGVPRA